MDPKIEEAIKFVHAYAPEISEWKVLKKELLKAIAPNYRKLFSTRYPKTKKPNFNDFEKSISAKWEQISGIKLIIKL